MSDTRTDKLEETVAHLSRIVEDLSEIVARQEREIDYLKRLLDQF